ncbi:hypothetical protein M885DRAFT_499990 [Pelagophyceae sp. CCMP2097]|nr:hypothetical protein M885DRAFT_499990 [Pelagophyceae sp. CCMP2097]
MRLWRRATPTRRLRPLSSRGGDVGDGFGEAEEARGRVYSRGFPGEDYSFDQPPRPPQSKTRQLNERIGACGTATHVLALFEENMENFDVVNVAMSLRRIGVMSASYHSSTIAQLHQLLQRATLSMAYDAEEWGPRELANAVWAVAKIRREPLDRRGGDVVEKDLFQKVAKVSVHKLGKFDPLELSKLTWSFSKAGYDSPALFRAVAFAVPQRILWLEAAPFSPQELLSVVWSFWNAKVSAPLLFAAVALEAPNKLALFLSPMLVNLVWAYTKADVPAPVLFDAVAAEAAKRVNEFEAHELVRL